MLAEGSPRGKDGLVFLSSSQYIATSGVQKCPICPFPRPTDPTVPAWFRPTPSIARRSLPATDKRRPHFYSRRVLSRRGRLKIRVLYYLAAFVRAWLGVRTCGDRKVPDRSFQREVFGKGKRQTSRLIKCACEKCIHARNPFLPLSLSFFFQ